MPNHAMQTAYIPDNTCYRIEKMARDFLWGSSNEKRKMHLVSWERVCKEKQVGGLGMRHIKQQNKAFTMKLGWGLVTKRDSLWVKVIRHKYGCGSDLIPHIKVKKSGSNIWSGIKNNWKQVQEGLQEARDNLGNIVARWKWEKSGTFTIKSAYKALNPPCEDPNRNWHKIWKLKVPQRCKAFAWLMQHERIITNQRKLNRGLHSNGYCDRCNQEVETEIHALRDCTVVRKCWETIIKPEHQIRFFSSNLQDWVQFNLKKHVGSNDGDWGGLFTVMCWLIWRARNEFTHSNTKTDQNTMIARALAIMQCMERATTKLKGVKMNTPQQQITKTCLEHNHEGGVVMVDGAYSVSTGSVACGGIVKNQNKDIQEGFLLRLDRGDHLTAELWGCLMGMKRAWDIGLRAVTVCCDSSEAVQTILNGENQLHEDWNTIQEIRQMLLWDWRVEIQVISREEKSEADKLAKIALNGGMGLLVLNKEALICLRP